MTEIQRPSTGQTAKEQAKYVARTTQEQARQAARQVGGQVHDEADSQTRRLAQGLRGFSDDLTTMSSNGPSDSPARGLVEQAAEGGRQAADWLDQRGLDGLLAELRSFARRRPGTFLLGAAVAGFAVGRLAKASTNEATTGGQALPEKEPDGTETR